MIISLGRLSGSSGVGRGGQLEVVAQAGVIRHIQWLSIRSSHERPRCLAMNDQPPRGANIGGQRFADQLVTKAERGGALFEQPALNPLFQVAQQLERGTLQDCREQIEVRCGAQQCCCAQGGRRLWASALAAHRDGFPQRGR